jgi:16S rRNA (adenine1518-N6/adenine1519-N6)-dimethyltransferase
VSASLLRAHGLSPKKALGQNFLTDPRAAERIAAAAVPDGGTVLEIGPGTGALTRPLLDRAERVVVIERDRDLVPILQSELAEPIAAGKLEIVSGDALAVDWLPLLESGPEPRAIAGNLPYLVTGRLLERSVELARHVSRVVVMVQLEVAERLAAAPSTKAYGALTVFVQAAFDVERLLVAKAGAFFPRPEVDSAVVVLHRRDVPRAVEDDALRALVKGAFGMRRKTLRNAWRGVFGWTQDEVAAHAAAAGIELDRRGETLSVEEFEKMARRARSAA